MPLSWARSYIKVTPGDRCVGDCENSKLREGSFPAQVQELIIYLSSTAGLPAAAQAAAGPGERPAAAQQPHPRPDHLRALQLRQLQVGGEQTLSNLNI